MGFWDDITTRVSAYRFGKYDQAEKMLKEAATEAGVELSGTLTLKLREKLVESAGTFFDSDKKDRKKDRKSEGIVDKKSYIDDIDKDRNAERTALINMLSKDLKRTLQEVNGRPDGNGSNKKLTFDNLGGNPIEYRHSTSASAKSHHKSTLFTQLKSKINHIMSPVFREMRKGSSRSDSISSTGSSRSDSISSTGSDKRSAKTIISRATQNMDMLMQSEGGHGPQLPAITPPKGKSTPKSPAR